MEHSWLLAIRPKTLSLSLLPVLLGSFIAAREGEIDLLVVGATLLTALLIQVGTNLYNDVGDALRGADSPQRIGPKRAVAEGWLSVDQVRRGAWISFALAAGAGLYLVAVGGVPILLIGLCSIAAGVAYTAGRLPIAYTQLGELFVFLFFGVAAVMGTVWLLRLQWSDIAFWSGCAVGLIAAAVLVVNNYRDIDTDRPAGKVTLAVRFGRRLTRRVYLLLLLLPFVLALKVVVPGYYPMMAPALLVALYLGYSIYRIGEGGELNRLLAWTAQFQLLFGVSLMMGMVQW